MLKIGKVYKLNSNRFYRILLLNNFFDLHYETRPITNFNFLLLEENTDVSKIIKNYYDEAKFFKILFEGNIRCLPIGQKFLLLEKIKFIEVEQ